MFLSTNSTGLTPKQGREAAGQGNGVAGCNQVSGLGGTRRQVGGRDAAAGQAADTWRSQGVLAQCWQARGLHALATGLAG